MIADGRIACGRLVTRLYEQGISNHQVLDAISQVPRHLFIDPAFKYKAYEDCALPIGCKQTISHPFMVAKMTELLFSSSRKVTKVLEIGTGSGYQTAVLAQLVDQVFSVERIAILQNKAQAILARLNITNVNFIVGDGTEGLAEFAPFDAILVAASAPQVPLKLVAQLAQGGLLVLPITENKEQYLHAIKREQDDKIKNYKLMKVKFVPLVKGQVM